MATLTMIKWYVEGTDFLAKMQSDVQAIESGSVPDIVTAYNDLSDGIQNDPEFQNILNDPNSRAKTVLQDTTSDSKTYLQSILLEVEDPGQAGTSNPYMPLFVGTVNYTRQGDSNTQTDGLFYDLESGPGTFDGADPAHLTNPTASLWDKMSDPNASLVTDATYTASNSAVSGSSMGTDWSTSGQIGITTGYMDGNYFAAGQGTLSQWAPFIHMVGGDPSALNADVMLNQA